MRELEDTLVREINRLNEKSKVAPLDSNDVNILVKLTSAWNNYMKSPIDEHQDDYDDLSKEELLALAKLEVSDEN